MSALSLPYLFIEPFLFDFSSFEVEDESLEILEL